MTENVNVLGSVARIHLGTASSGQSFLFLNTIDRIIECDRKMTNIQLKLQKLVKAVHYSFTH